MSNLAVKPSLAVIMLTYNEINSLRLSYNILMNALKKAGVVDYEIIIATTVSPSGFDDGSSGLARQIASENPRVRCSHSQKYQGMAPDFHDALKIVTKEYVTMVPGSNVHGEDSLANIFNHLGTSEGIIAHTINLYVRPFIVRWVSRGFVLVCNILFFLRIKYYNGIFIFPTKFMRAVPVSAKGGEYAAEIVIYLVKSGMKYIQVPQVINPLLEGGKTFCMRNVRAAIKTLVSLFWRIHFKRERIDLSALRSSQGHYLETEFPSK